MTDIDVLISEKEVAERTKELGAEISKDYKDKEISMICVLKGGVMFMTDLAKEIEPLVSMDFMAISSYGNETSSSGIVKIIKDLDEPIEGKEVLIVEDIIDSGRTLSYLERFCGTIQEHQDCDALDNRPQGVDVDVEYVGFSIPDHFVVGYGLDYCQHYRNLPFIGVYQRCRIAEGLV